MKPVQKTQLRDGTAQAVVMPIFSTAELGPYRLIDHDRETEMPGVPTVTVSPICAKAMPEMKNAARSRPERHGCFVLAVAAVLVLAACGDIKITPVDHSCPVENACQHAGGR
jgi:hypothetical protein